MILEDSRDVMRRLEDDTFNCVIADPPYDNQALINLAITQAGMVCSGPSLFFMYAENIVDLQRVPDQILHWVKPISTKNTSKRYSRFVEVIACFDLDRSPFNQDTHWSSRSGVFTDSLVRKQVHPFEKPESLIEKLLAVHTNKDDFVLDPFAGSGTVERVCGRMGRKCLSVEIDEQWHQA